MKAVKWGVIFTCLGFIIYAIYQYYIGETSLAIILGAIPILIGSLAKLLKKNKEKYRINQLSGDKSPIINNNKGDVSINYTSQKGKE